MADSFTPEQIENMNKFFELINSSVTPLTQLQKEELDAAAATKEANNRFKEMSKTLKEQLGGSFISFGKAIASTEQGFSKYSSAIGSATSAIGDFAGGLGKLGAGIGFVIKAFGALTQAAFEQNDQLMRAYSGLSDLGSVTEGGLEGLTKQLHNVGLSISEYEKLIDVLKPVTGSLTAFAGSVTAGRESLTNVIAGFIGPDNALERSLLNIGYTTDDIRAGVADYVQMQTRLGRAQGKSTSDLVAQSQKYLIEMKGLQELTGMTRDEQQKARDAMMSDARFSMHLAGMKDEEAKNLQNYMLAYQKTFGSEAAAGLKDRIVNLGAITTDAAGASFMRNNREYENALLAAAKGPAAFAELLGATINNTKNTIDSMRGSIMFAENGLRDMGLNNEVLNAVLAMSKMPQEEYATRLKELSDITANQGGQLGDNIKADQQARAIKLLGDAALAKASKGLIGIFTELYDVVFSFGKMVAKIVDWITANTPYLEATDLSSFFGETSEGAVTSGRDAPTAVQLQQREQSRASLSTSAVGRESEILNSLNFGGKRAERTGGGESNTKLIALAERIQKQYGKEGVTFTALNDMYHHKSGSTSGSLHKKGMALDFVLNKKPSKEEAKLIQEQLLDMGASKALDEYYNKSAAATGDHFHVEVARHGGLFSGKDSGYPVMLHGKNESVWPEKDLTTFMKDVQKTSLEQYKQELMTQILPSSSGDLGGSVIADAFSTFSSKLDILISEQRKNNGIQDEILTYSRA